MSIASHHVPKYRRHKASGQAITTFNGRPRLLPGALWQQRQSRSLSATFAGMAGQ